jgi:hypothetical protein
VVLPGADGAVDKLRGMVSLSEELNCPGPGPAPRYALELSGAEAERLLAGPAAGRVVLPFATRHRIASLGYCVVHRKQTVRRVHTLDEEGWPLAKAALGQRVRQLKEGSATADEIFETEEHVELAYTGDTTAAWLEAAAAGGAGGAEAEATASARRALRAKVLVTEATFLCDGVSPEQAAERGHTHIDQIAARAAMFEGVGQLVLTHFSRRYTERQIHEALRTRLPPELLGKTHALILRGHHREERDRGADSLLEVQLSRGRADSL